MTALPPPWLVGKLPTMEVACVAGEPSQVTGAPEGNFLWFIRQQSLDTYLIQGKREKKKANAPFFFFSLTRRVELISIVTRREVLHDFSSLLADVLSHL